jgi:hypothetical protein
VSQPNDPIDPIVQILQEAARRGFEIMRQREQTADTTPLNTNAHGEGHLCKDGENGNSRNCACKGLDQNVTDTSNQS